MFWCWIDRSFKSRVGRSICRQILSANLVPPWEENGVPILEKVTTCVQPPTSPYSPPNSFLVRACASETSKIVKMSVYQRCKNIQLCRACSLVRPLFLFFSVKNSSLLSILFTVGRLSCTDPFRIISLSLFQEAFPVFNFQFLSFQSIEIDNCYILYIDIIYVNF